MPSIRTGDVVFDRAGQPAAVTNRSDVKGTVELNKDRADVRKKVRHGYINGIEGKERQEMLSILDQAKEQASPEERVAFIGAKVSLIEKDPTQQKLASYLRSQMMHIMHSYNIKPKKYVLQEAQTR